MNKFPGTEMESRVLLLPFQQTIKLFIQEIFDLTGKW